MHPIVDFTRDKLGVKLFPGQASALSDYYSSGCPNWLLLAGRRSGKSLLSDIIVCYEALVPDLSAYIRPGEDRYILIVSVRADNAALHIRNISKLLKHDRSIKRMIVSELQDRIILSNGVTILSLPASARAGRGFTCSTLLLDELAFFMDSLGNASADSVYDALSPTVATFGDAGRVVITTSVNTRTGIIYDLYDRSISGELSDFHVLKTDSRSLNPKVSERVINNALKRDPEAGQAEYLSIFRDPLENFLDPERVDLSIDRGRGEAITPDPSRVYVMAIDPATMRDRYAFIVMHKDGDLFMLDYARSLKPPVNPNEAEDLLMSLVDRYNPDIIRCDLASTVQRLQDSVPSLEYTPFTRPFKLKIYGALKEALNLGKVVLYPHPELTDELKALQIRNGVDIAAPKSGKVTHDDLSDCLALCVDVLSTVEYSGRKGHDAPFTIFDPSVNVGFDMYDDRDFGWVDRGSIWEKPHPPGVDWTNCPHRLTGCRACYRETEAERQREAEFYKGHVPLSPEAFEQWRNDIYQPFDPLSTERQRDPDIKRTFWKGVSQDAKQ